MGEGLGGYWLRVGRYWIPLEVLSLAGLVMRPRDKVREFIGECVHFWGNGHSDCARYS